MYKKCIIFGDMESAEEVLHTDDPAKQQAIGRQVSGYKDSIWAGVRQAVLFRGLVEKFRQNEKLKKAFLDTYGPVFVECAGSDRIWACGIRLDDKRRFDTANWAGQNILGFTLTEVWRAIKSEDWDDGSERFTYYGSSFGE